MADSDGVVDRPRNKTDVTRFEEIILADLIERKSSDKNKRLIKEGTMDGARKQASRQASRKGPDVD